MLRPKSPQSSLYGSYLYDRIVPNPMNPQSFNRYSYVLNNPLKYIDPTGHRYRGPRDDGGWYYESLAKAAGIDPTEGRVIILEKGDARRTPRK